MELTFVTKKGKEISGLFDDLAQLRIKIFRDFPYLYEGSIDYEKHYLETYSNAERAMLFSVYRGTEMVGATTCIPLIDETIEVTAPFEQASLDINSIFYFGESILQKEYRGLGIGHRFFDERENYAKHFGTFKTACFCAVERDINHPMRPDHYRPNDAFWRKRGYIKDPLLQSLFEWTDIGEKSPTTKTMTYWTKQL